MMKTWILDFSNSSRVPALPLVLFKLGLTATILCQSVGFLLDAKWMFADDGLFPASLAQIYDPAGLFSFGSWTAILLACGLLVLCLLSLRTKWQSLSFFGLAVLEWVFLRRNFAFANAGDSVLVFLSVMAALTPSMSWKNRESSVAIRSVLPLFALNSILYLVNFGAKLSSRWSIGAGLSDSLRHYEMTRFDFGPATSLAWVFLDFAAIAVVAFAILVPWLSFERFQWRNRAVFIVILYHLLANALFRLSWLSLPFIAFELSLLASPVLASARTVPRSSRKEFIAWVLILIGFFGMKEPGDLTPFSESAWFPVGHNWYMFAPPPPATTRWSVSVKTGEDTVTRPLSAFLKEEDFALFQHYYKFVNNLRKAEFTLMTEHFARWLCQNSLPSASAVQLKYQTLVFESNEMFHVEYNWKNCSEPK